MPSPTQYTRTAEEIVDEIYSSRTVSDAYGWLRLRNYPTYTTYPNITSYSVFFA